MKQDLCQRATGNAYPIHRQETVSGRGQQSAAAVAPATTDAINNAYVDIVRDASPSKLAKALGVEQEAVEGVRAGRVLPVVLREHRAHLRKGRCGRRSQPVRNRFDSPLQFHATPAMAWQSSWNGVG